MMASKVIRIVLATAMLAVVSACGADADPASSPSSTGPAPTTGATTAAPTSTAANFCADVKAFWEFEKKALEDAFAEGQAAYCLPVRKTHPRVPSSRTPRRP